jgi:NDP-sugar pyrophosphorylase family protein
MKAMILAAGRGTRLRPLTDTCPKPMVPIGERPLLEHVIRLLAKHGFDELVINLYHLPHIIQDHFKDGNDWGVHINYSLEEELLGTAGAVAKIAGFFDEPFLVYYGDHLSNVDLSTLWQAHRREGGIASLGLLDTDEDPTTRGICELDEQSRIVRFIEKPAVGQVPSRYMVNAGIYLLEPQVLSYLPTNEVSDFGFDIFPKLLNAGHTLYGHRLTGSLLATDTAERYAHAQQETASGRFKLP